MGNDVLMPPQRYGHPQKRVAKSDVVGNVVGSNVGGAVGDLKGSVVGGTIGDPKRQRRRRF